MPGSIPDGDTLGALLEALDDVVVLIDHDRTIRYMNRIETDHRPEDVIGQQAMSVVADGNREDTLAVLDGVFEKMEPAKHITEVVGNDGSSTWFEGRMIPVVRDGRTVSVAVVTRNVTERIVAEEEVRMLRKLLPLCAWCKKVRTESGEWQALEAYLEEASQSRVSHGMCPTCEQEMRGNASTG